MYFGLKMHKDIKFKLLSGLVLNVVLGKKSQKRKKKYSLSNKISITS